MESTDAESSCAATRVVDEAWYGTDWIGVVTTGSGLEAMYENGVKTNIVVMKEAILRFKKLAI